MTDPRGTRERRIRGAVGLGFLAVAVLALGVGRVGRHIGRADHWVVTDQPADSATGTPRGLPKRVVFADERLWILSDGGGLLSLGKEDKTLVPEKLEPRVFDVCAWNGVPLVMACNGDRCANLALLRRTGGSWSLLRALDVGEVGTVNVLMMSCSQESITLLTRRKVFQVRGGDVRASGEWMPAESNDQLFVVTSVHANGDAVFVGLNAGEWGGGMVRIDMRSGKSSLVSRVTSGKICGEPLDPSCDPVNALETEPWNPRCVVAAVGLVHFSPHGRLIEICDQDVKTLYTNPTKAEAFYGLVRSGDGLWAAGVGGIYRIEKGSARKQPLPKFHPVSGLGLASFDIPGLVVLATYINAGMSIGGSVPILVAR